MVQEYLNWQMVISMMDSGLMASKTVVESTWIQPLGSSIAENGKRGKKMGKDTLNSLTKSITTAHSSRVLKKDMALRYLSMEISTRVNIKMVNSMEKENTYGRMAPVTRDSSKRGSGKAKAAGNQQKLTEISISARTKATRKMVMEGTCGPTDACTKADSPTTLSKNRVI